MNAPSSKPKPSEAENLLDLRNKTLKKLNIDPGELARAPKIAAILEESGVDNKTAIEAMRFSHDSNIVEFLKAYDTSTITDRISLPFEAFGIMAGVNMKALLGAIIVELRDRSANIVKTILTVKHPDVTRASIENALKPGGVQDRKQIHTAMRLLPVAKGATVLVSPGGSGATVIDGEIEGEDVDTEALFPNLEETQRLLEE